MSIFRKIEIQDIGDVQCPLKIVHMQHFQLALPYSETWHCVVYWSMHVNPLAVLTIVSDKLDINVHVSEFQHLHASTYNLKGQSCRT